MKAPSAGTTSLVLPGKVQPRHLDRLAIVYVRQSTLQQLEQHRESTRAAVRARRTRLPAGLAAPRVSRHRRRPRLLRRLGRGPAGLPAAGRRGRARPCRPGARLRGVAPRPLLPRLVPPARDLRPGRHADRRQRRRLRPGALQRPAAARAQGHDERGRAAHHARPARAGALAQGRTRRARASTCRAATSARASGEVVLDPDERVRDTIRLVFDVFERRGSVHGVLRYLVDHDIALPDRDRGGPARARSSGAGRTAAPFSTC